MKAVQTTLNFVFRLRASHFLACHNAPGAYRHDHNFEVTAAVTHDNSIPGLTAVTSRLHQLQSYAVERFNGRDLNAQMPVGIEASAEGLAFYLFDWFDLMLADQLQSIRVNDFTNPPAVADRTPNAESRRAQIIGVHRQLLTEGASR